MATERGKVKWFDDSKGFKTLSEDDEVEFTVTQGLKGRATLLKINHHSCLSKSIAKFAKQREKTTFWNRLFATPHSLT